MAERLGTGLQNHLQQFESARDLKRKLSDKFPSVEIAAPRFFQRFFYTQSLPGNPSRHRTSPLPASRYKTNNMKRTLLLVLVIAIFNPCIASSLRGASPVTEGRAPIPFLDTLFQERTEIVFQFIETDPVQIEALSRMVSIDRNNNGIPDDEWYELAGSEYHKPTTRHNAKITYHRPAADKMPTPDKNSPITDTTYILWETDDGKRKS